MARTPKLTSIPTPTHILVEAPQFVAVALPDPAGRTPRRTLCVAKEIDEFVCLRSPGDDFNMPRLRALLQRYIEGLYVSGAMNGDPEKRHPDFERLQNLDEVWAMCFRAPQFNQWRLLGRFAARDTFVGLALYRRAVLDGDAKYHRLASEIVDLWTKAVPGIAPLKANAIGDYISQPVRDLYAPIL